MVVETHVNQTRNMQYNCVALLNQQNMTPSKESLRGSIHWSDGNSSGKGTTYQLQGTRENTEREMILSSSNSTRRMISCGLMKCCCRCHENITKTGWHWSLRLPLLFNLCSRESCSKTKSAALWISLTRIGIPYAFIASLEVLWNSQRSYISPSLQIQRLVSWESPAYKLIKDIRYNRIEFVEGRRQIVDIFDSGKASPFDILPDGKTWTEVDKMYTVQDVILI